MRRPAAVIFAAVLAFTAVAGCDFGSTTETDTSTVRVKILAHGYPSTIFADHDGYTSSLVSDQPYTYEDLAAVHVRNVPLRTERAGCEIQVNGSVVASSYPDTDGVVAACEWADPHLSSHHTTRKKRSGRH